jgi:hypothetical protein
MQTLPEMVETCRINCANDSYPSDDDLHTAHYQRNAALYERMSCSSLFISDHGLLTSHLGLAYTRHVRSSRPPGWPW